MSEVPLYAGGTTAGRSRSVRWTCTLRARSKFEGYVTNFAPRKSLKSIKGGKFTFDEISVVNRVGGKNTVCEVDLDIARKVIAGPLSWSHF